MYFEGTKWDFAGRLKVLLTNWSATDPVTGGPQGGASGAQIPLQEGACGAPPPRQIPF